MEKLFKLVFSLFFMRLVNILLVISVLCLIFVVSLGFFDFEQSVTGNVVKWFVSDCDWANNYYNENKDNYDCRFVYDMEVCESGVDELKFIIVRHEYMKWDFVINGERTVYLYNFTDMSCVVE